MHAVKLIPALTDNYIFAIEGPNQQVLIVDPSESDPVEEYLQQNKLSLTGILITHHHNDHVGGVLGLLKKYSSSAQKIPVWVPEADRGRWAFGDHEVKEGSKVHWNSFDFEVWELPGHTMDHVAYWDSKNKRIFSGDVLFGMGCGRVFEGSFEQMRESLLRFLTLPEGTEIYSAHEYTEANLEFLHQQKLNKENSEFLNYEKSIHDRRLQGKPTVPLLLDQERRWNPFLTAKDLCQFGERREARNQFSPSRRAR